MIHCQMIFQGTMLTNLVVAYYTIASLIKYSHMVWYVWGPMLNI
jgi:hypothetical protein